MVSERERIRVPKERQVPVQSMSLCRFGNVESEGGGGRPVSPGEGCAPPTGPTIVIINSPKYSRESGVIVSQVKQQLETELLRRSQAVATA